MPIVVKSLLPLSFALAVTALGCHAQPPARSSVSAVTQQGTASISPDLARRIEVMVRSRSDVPSSYEFHILSLSKSDVPGYDQLSVNFSAEGGTSKPIHFLLSGDGKTLAQFTKFDIGKDLRTLVSPVGRPARGGPANAPVLIVGFDDLECPYCARMNAQLFPALLDRYKDQVRIVYRDYPIDQHPWALRAAIDANCVGAQNGTGYWNLIDHIHAHADEIGGTERTIARANEMLDDLAREEGKKQKLDEVRLSACIAKQDTAAIETSKKEAEALGVEATPALFINGEKIEGAQPIEDVYRMIDGALIAAGRTPPPLLPPATIQPVVQPAPPPAALPVAPPAAPPAAQPAAQPSGRQAN